MKNLILMILLSFSLGTIAQEKTVILEVPDMYCALCPITVKKALLKVNGVKKVEASLKTKTALVVYEDSLTHIDELTLATEEAGYPSFVQQKE